MDTILSLVTGSIGGGIAIWLLRDWITERLRRSIEHEYAAKLETHKADLTSKLAALSREFDARQLRTSLFFEHRRQAFAAVLAAAVEMRDEWLKLYDPEEVAEPVPLTAYNKLQSAFYTQQLFLDRSSVASVELLLEAAGRSFPFVDALGVHPQDADGPLDQVNYMLPLLADLFRDRIGLEPSTQAERKLSLLGAIQIVNRYHFTEIGLPVKGDLRLTDERAADAVVKAEHHANALVSKLREFRTHLDDRRLGVFHEAATDLDRYIATLEDTGASSRVPLIALDLTKRSVGMDSQIGR